MSIRISPESFLPLQHQKKEVIKFQMIYPNFCSIRKKKSSKIKLRNFFTQTKPPTHREESFLPLL
jgi:hypothetical protein